VPRREASAPTLFVVCTSGAALSASEPDAFAVQAGSLVPVVAAIRSAGAREAAVLATSRGTEAYVVAATAEDACRTVSEGFHRALGSDVLARSGALAVRQGADAARHLLRLACGLEPPLAGDVPVLGEVRRAYEAAQAAHGAGPLVRRVFQAALAAATHASSTGAAVADVEARIEAELGRLDEWRVRRDAFSMLVA
jgi:glutamyl-tRNA reductase